VAGPGRRLGRAAENGVLERLGGAQTAGAGHGGVAVPRGVGGEVTLPRSHLVKAARGELVQAHKRVGFYRGWVWVSGRVGRGLVPLFYEEVFAVQFELRVGAARGGLRVELADQVLGGHWEGIKPIGAQEEQHRVGKGIEREVGPVFRGWSGLDPREG